jgi:hypothetical protein
MAVFWISVSTALAVYAALDPDPTWWSRLVAALNAAAAVSNALVYLRRNKQWPH